MSGNSYRWIVCASVILAGCSAGPAATASSVASTGTCPVTSAPTPAFVPPTPYPPQPPPQYGDQFWYGTPDLWTMLSPDGTWSGLPKSSDGYGQKVFWWSADFSAAREPQPGLTVTGSRLDGQVGPLVASSATNASADFGQAMLVGVAVPTAGCWEITGHYRGHDLSFVVRVEP